MFHLESDTYAKVHVKDKRKQMADMTWNMKQVKLYTLYLTAIHMHE